MSKDIYEINEIIQKIKMENEIKREEKIGDIIELDELIFRNNRRIGEILEKVEKIAVEDEEKEERIEREINKVLEIEERIKKLENDLKNLKLKRDIMLKDSFYELKKMI